MRKDCPLAEKSQIEIDDILPYPVFCSEQAAKVDLSRWCGENIDQLNVMATFNLTGNAAIFAREGLGITLTFDKLIEIDKEGDLCFRKITPVLQTKMYVIWKKYQVFTPVAQLLLEKLKRILSLEN